MEQHVGRRLLLVDACRNAPSKNPNKSSHDGIQGRRYDLPEGTAIFFSCRAGQQSFTDLELNHSLFTFCLLEGLKGEGAVRSEVTWDGLVNHVKTRMAMADMRSRVPAEFEQSPINAGSVVHTVLGKIREQPGVPAPPPDQIKPVPQFGPFQMRLADLNAGQAPAGWRTADAIGARQFDDYVPKVLGPTAIRPQQIESPPLQPLNEFCLNLEFLAPRGGQLTVELLGAQDPLRLVMGTRGGRLAWNVPCEFLLPDSTPNQLHRVFQKVSFSRCVMTLLAHKGQLQVYVDGRNLSNQPLNQFALEQLRLLFERSEGLGISRLRIHPVIRNGVPLAGPLAPLPLKPPATETHNQRVLLRYEQLALRGDFELVFPVNQAVPLNDPGHWFHLALCGANGAVDLPVVAQWGRNGLSVRIQGDEQRRNMKRLPARFTLRCKGNVLSFLSDNEEVLAPRLNFDPSVGQYDELLLERSVKSPLGPLQLWTAQGK
jgi:hypothetical protein